MPKCCPISYRKADPYQERIEAFFTAVAVAGFILSCSLVMPLILITDFFLKLSSKNRYSLFRPASRLCKHLFNLPQQSVDDAPKRFARVLGMIMSVNLAILYLFDLHEPAVILSIIFITFALLDAFFDFCVGCKLYMLLKKV